MQKNLKKSKNGAVTVIFLTVIALVLTLILAATQSQLLLSLRRSQSAADILVATYEAESEVNDIMAKLVGGYLSSANIPRTVKNVGDIRLEIEGSDFGGTQTVSVTAFRGYAVGKVEAIRRITSIEEVNDVEIVLMLDCTSSMDATSGSLGETRMNAQEAAAINFVNRISTLPDSDKFNVGVGVFGVDGSWLNFSGQEVTPDSGLSFSEISDAISDGFGNTRGESQCNNTVQNGTSVGTAFRFAHDYFNSATASDTKRIEVVITDGEPNTRILDPECPPNISCDLSNLCEPEAKDYLRCTVADANTFVPEIAQNGVRDPNVDAYAVTIFDNPPSDVVDILRSYTTVGGYFNASQANQLTGILDTLLTNILESNSSITIKRVVPTPQ